MYAREQGRLTIDWNPEDTDLGEQAMQNIVDSDFTWSGESDRVTVDDATAADVRAEYQRLVEEQTA